MEGECMNPGSIVRCRNREWVLLPAETDEVFALWPLTGTTDDVVHVHRGLMNLVGYGWQDLDPAHDFY
jgi:hypothetical protein